MTSETSELTKMTARAVVELLKSGELRPLDLIETSAARMALIEPQINAMPTQCVERARRSANQVSSHSLLAGLPIAVKDLTPVAGVKTTYGTLGYMDFVPDQSDPLVERMESNGALVIGKSNTPEMGAGGNTFNDVFGVTRNPWNIKKNAGGSSGGSGAALAAGEVWLAHGSDLGGSLRTPAAYCGVVGLRPSPGRAGGGGKDNLFAIEGVQGPMARNVRDCALFLDAMGGFDDRRPISLEAPAQSFLSAAMNPTCPGRIAYARTHDGVGEVEAEIHDILVKALASLQPDCVIQEYCPSLPDLERVYRILRAISWAAGPGCEPDHVQRHFKTTLRQNIDDAATFTTEDMVLGMRGRSLIYRNMHEFFGQYDLLASPVVGLEPGPVEVEYPKLVDGKPMNDYIDWLRYSFLATTAALPAISIPAGFTKSGMPVGIQLIGPAKSEARLLSMAAWIEDAWDLARHVPIDPR